MKTPLLNFSKFILTFGLTLASFVQINAQCAVATAIAYNAPGDYHATTTPTVPANWEQHITVDFGDGTSGYTYNGTANSYGGGHIYAANGTYFVSTYLSAHDPADTTINCASTDFDTLYISDIICQLPPAIINLGQTNASNGLFDYQFTPANISTGPNALYTWHVTDSIGNTVAQISNTNGDGFAIGMTSGLYNVNFTQTTYDSLTMISCSGSTNRWFTVGDSIPPSTCGLQANMITEVYFDRITAFLSANGNVSSSYVSLDGVLFWNYPDTTRFYSQTPGLHNVCYYVEDTTSASFCYDSVCVILTTTVSQCSASFNLFADSTNAGAWYAINNSTSNSGSMMYIWDFGDGDTDYSPYPTHTYTTPGNYVICLTIIDLATNCSSSTCDSSAAFRISQTASTNAIMGSLTVLAPQVGIEEKLTVLNGMNLFPSPMQENTTISLNSDLNSKAKIEVVNILGSVVLSNEVAIAKGNNQLKLNTSILESGIYIINVISTNRVIASVKAIK